MFDVLPNLLSSVATILFPIFASYKALKNNDPAQLTPWLMYWVVLACVMLVESWTEWLLVWLPFYSWIRFFSLLYLVLPQTQGARLLYQEHVHPFLATHEADIDALISNAHDRVKTVGLQYFWQAVEFVKENILGMQPKRRATPPPSSGSYAQNLFARFYLPSARQGISGSTADFYGLLSTALGQVTASSASREAQAEDLSASGTLIPPNVRSKEERMSYIATQRERLRVVLTALEKEAYNISFMSSSSPTQAAADSHDPAVPGTLSAEAGGVPMMKTKSEGEFEQVEREDMGEVGQKASGGWMPWNWRAKSTAAQPVTPTEPEPEPEQATTTATDRG